MQVRRLAADERGKGEAESKGVLDWHRSENGMSGSGMGLLHSASERAANENKQTAGGGRRTAQGAGVTVSSDYFWRSHKRAASTSRLERPAPRSMRKQQVKEAKLRRRPISQEKVKTPSIRDANARRLDHHHPP